MIKKDKTIIKLSMVIARLNAELKFQDEAWEKQYNEGLKCQDEAYDFYDGLTQLLYSFGRQEGTSQFKVKEEDYKVFYTEVCELYREWKEKDEERDKNRVERVWKEVEE